MVKGEDLGFEMITPGSRPAGRSYHRSRTRSALVLLWIQELVRRVKDNRVVGSSGERNTAQAKGMLAFRRVIVVQKKVCNLIAELS
jgi:hypothetical protein